MAKRSTAYLEQKSDASCAAVDQIQSAGDRSHGPGHHADSACHRWYAGWFCQFGAKTAGWGAEWYSEGDDRKLGKQGCTHQPCRQGISVSKVLAGITKVNGPWQGLLWGKALYENGHVNVVPQSTALSCALHAQTLIII